MSSQVVDEVGRKPSIRRRIIKTENPPRPYLPLRNIIINKKELSMKMIAVLLFSLFAQGCAETKDEVFSLEEANKCLFESDKNAVLEAVVWIRKADAAKDEKEAVEYFEKAYEPIQELYSASRDDDSTTGRKRSAALAWVLAQPLQVFAEVSASTPERFASNLRALEIQLTEPELRFMDLQ